MEKRKGLHSIYIIALALVLCIVSLSSSSNSYPVAAEEDEETLKYEAKLSEAKKLKKEYEQQKAKAEETIAEFKREKENIEAYIKELDLQLNDISLQMFELETKIAENEKELEKTKKKLKQAKKKEKDQYEIMKKRIQYMYENGNAGMADVLLGVESMADLLNQVEYMQSITEYDNSLLEKYNAAKKKVADTADYLKASIEELEQLNENCKLEKETLDELMELKSKEIEEYTEKIGITDELLFYYISEISAQEANISDIIQKEEERQKELERKRLEEEQRRKEEEERRRLEQEQNNDGGSDDNNQGSYEPEKPSSTAGYDANAINNVKQTDETDPYKMIWPLPGDHRTYSKYGYRVAPLPGASTYHRGWDIGGEFGAPLVSVLAGTVVSTSYNSSGGNVVKVDHGGIVSVYCHCSKILVSDGQYVKQGQQVALVGSTGVSTAPHLHFGIQIDGEYVDPAPYIAHLE